MAKLYGSCGRLSNISSWNISSSSVGNVTGFDPAQFLTALGTDHPDALWETAGVAAEVRVTRGISNPRVYVVQARTSGGTVIAGFNDVWYSDMQSTLGISVVGLNDSVPGVDRIEVTPVYTPVTREVTKLYGSVNDQTKEIKKLYGSVNGQTKLIYQA